MLEQRGQVGGALTQRRACVLPEPAHEQRVCSRRGARTSSVMGRARAVFRSSESAASRTLVWLSLPLARPPRTTCMRRRRRSKHHGSRAKSSSPATPPNTPPRVRPRWSAPPANSAEWSATRSRVLSESDMRWCLRLPMPLRTVTTRQSMPEARGNIVGVSQACHAVSACYLRHSTCPWRATHAALHHAFDSSKPAYGSRAGLLKDYNF